jgi:SAM-dependent methyltransferase
MLGPCERYLPELRAPHTAYEHWHRYLLATRFVAGKEVLDVACGEGYGSDLLAAHAARVTGVDLDPEVVRRAAHRYPRENLTFLAGSVDRVPVAGGAAFDVIVSFETIEHVTPDVQARFLDEARRLLRPGGLLIVSTPNRAAYSEKQHYHNPYHFHEFAGDEFRAFLGSAFPNVRVVCQRVYAGSYVWSPGQSSAELTEFQVEWTEGGIRPAAGDRKEELYYLAICSDGPVPDPGHSLLLDADDVAFSHAGEDAAVSTLYVDDGGGFREDLACRQPAAQGEFELTFPLDSFPPARGLRWDPVEQRLCRLRLEAVEWVDGDGLTHRLDPAAVASNGTTGPSGEIAFETFDPVVYLPVAGPVRRVTLRGRCEADDLATSLATIERGLREARTPPPHTTTLYADDGGGFREDLACRLPLAPGGAFELTFPLDDFPPARALRWDPTEGRPCRVRLDAVTWRDAAGRDHPIDPDGVATNGDRDGDGAYRFDTLDPFVVLPVAGEVRAVTVRGWWEVDPEAATIVRLDADRRAARAELVTTWRERDAARVELAAETDRQQGLTSTLFVDDGDGFRPDLALSHLAPAGGNGEFTLVFPVPEARPVQGLRWDPFEYRLGRVRLSEVTWTAADGGVRAVDLAGVTSNGAPAPDGWHEFDTPDPSFYLPVSGPVTGVTIRGTWESDSPQVSQCRLHDLVRVGRQRLEELEALRQRLLAEAEAVRERQLAEAEAVRERQLAEAEGRHRRQLADRELLLRKFAQVAREELAASLTDNAVLRQQAGGLRGQVGELRGRLAAREQELAEAGRRLDDREANLRAVLTSRKWRFITRAAAAVYFLPRLLTAYGRSLRGRVTRLPTRAGR